MEMSTFFQRANTSQDCGFLGSMRSYRWKSLSSTWTNNYTTIKEETCQMSPQERPMRPQIPRAWVTKWLNWNFFSSCSLGASVFSKLEDHNIRNCQGEELSTTDFGTLNHDNQRGNLSCAWFLLRQKLMVPSEQHGADVQVTQAGHHRS